MLTRRKHDFSFPYPRFWDRKIPITTGLYVRDFNKSKSCLRLYWVFLTFFQIKLCWEYIANNMIRPTDFTYYKIENSLPARSEPEGMLFSSGL